MSNQGELTMRIMMEMQKERCLKQLSWQMQYRKLMMKLIRAIL